MKIVYGLIGVTTLLLATVALVPVARDFFTGVTPAVQPPTPLPSEGESLPFSLPEGFAVSVFSDTVRGARALARDPRGALVVSLPDSGKVVALPDRDNDNTADAVVPILEGLDKPHGIVFNCPEVPPSPCMLYVAEQSKVAAYFYDAETMHATLQKTLVQLPARGGHSTRSLLLHPDGKRLLVATGSSCNVCVEEDERRAAILAVDVETGEVSTFSRGLRNTVFMAVHPVTGDIWGTDMGRDHLGDDLPPDEVNILRDGGNPIREPSTSNGAGYGWPYCYGKNIQDMNFDASNRAAEICAHSIPSHIDLQAHSAPLGLAFVPEEGWPEEYWHDLLVAYHGSWNRSTPTGYKIVRFDLTPQGQPTGRVQDFMSNFRTDTGELYGRPVDIMLEPGGTMWVSDDRAGVVYRVFRTE